MKCIKKSDESIDEVVKYLKDGKVVIIPTDTVYGFSGIVDLKNNNEYITDVQIRKIKGREESKPLIQLIGEGKDLFSYTEDKIPSSVLEKWPGPLTIVVNTKKNCSLSQPMDTVAFRCPGDEWLRKVIQKLGAPIYSTSVNRSGKAVLGCIDDIKDEFGEEVDLIVDDGDKAGNVPSTIICMEGDSLKVLRQGAVNV